MISFEGCHFPKHNILHAVYFYLRYSVSLQDLEEILAERVNNRIEQDHRFIKRRTRPMLGFKSFGSATATIDGIEVAHMIRKKQFDLVGSGFAQFAALAG